MRTLSIRNEAVKPRLVEERKPLAPIQVAPTRRPVRVIQPLLLSTDSNLKPIR
jgi:hypothetical protein